MVELKERYKIFIMSILLAFASYITYYFHIILGTGVVFTHFFYIPIILASLWWKRKGLVVAIFLSGLLVLSNIFDKKDVPVEDFLRAMMFIVIGLLVVILSEKITIREEALKRSDKFLRTVINSMHDALSVIDVNDFRIIAANSVFLKMYGLKEEDVIGKPCYQITHQRSEQCKPPDDICPIETIKTGKLSLIEHIHYVDGNRTYVEVSASPIVDESGKITQFIHITRDISERKRAQEALAQSEEKYRTLYDSSSDAIMMLDEKGFFDCNNATLRMFGFLKKEDFLKLNPADISPPYQPDGTDSFTAANSKIAEAFKKGTNHFEWVHRRQNGEDFPAGVLLTAFQLIERQVLQATIRDLTERKKAEEQLKTSLREKELLLQEIHHRVKNNIQVISSLLSLQSEHITEKKYRDMFQESQNRILSMSLIHEKLYKSSDFSKIDFNDYINDFVSDLFDHYGANTGNIALNVNIENVSLGIDLAIPCGLIVHELVTNSLKYAFPDGRKGELKISLRSIGEDMIELLISDNGIGIPKDLDFENTQSLGMYLVKMLVENQLQGEIHLDRSKGTEFKIKFKGEKS